ncbi:MAG: ABC transporter permease [Ruminococcus sp.]|nr:ABC transporter permease [Ruminococcus sp.]
MKNKKILYTVMTAVNVISLTGTLILTIVGSSLAKSQRYNSASERWDSAGNCSQISCFLADDSGFSTDSAGGIKSSIYAELKNISIVPEDNQKLVPEAYSASAGQVSIRSDTTTGRSEAELTVAGGDFFLFRDFYFIDGSYFTENDIMQDGAVIDRSLAWSLYGAENVSGKNIYINGTKFYIAGVIENPQTKPEQKTAGELPRAYISYEGANLLNLGDMDIMGGSSGFKKISCYECIVPNPVENYAYNAVNNYFESAYKNKCTVVNNSERFKPSVRASAFKDISDYAVINNMVIYPYWENASRIVEFKLTSLYFCRRLTYIIPVMTALYLLVLLYKGAGRLRRNITEWIRNKIEWLIYNHNEKKRQKKENI